MELEVEEEDDSSEEKDDSSEEEDDSFEEEDDSSEEEDDSSEVEDDSSEEEDDSSEEENDSFSFEEETELEDDEEEAEMEGGGEMDGKEQPSKPRCGVFFLSCTCCRSHAAARCRAHATRAGPLGGALVVGKYLREVLITGVA